MESRRSATLGGVAALILIALPGTASGAAFTALKPCYVSLPGTTPQTELINVSGTGFAPRVATNVDVDGKRAITGAAVDAAGNLAAEPPPAPFVRTGDRPFSLVAFQNEQPVVTATPQVTALNVGIRPRRARPSRRVLIRGRGFTGPGKVYAHYRFRGRTRRTVTFTPKGPCGRFAARRRQIPVKRPRTGRWTVQFDQERTYARRPSSVFVRLTILVSRRVRLSRAAAAEAADTRVVGAGLAR